MDKATLAVIVSSVSAVIAGLSLGWNVYRDVILKPRLKVRFAIRKRFTPGINQMSKFISISATNLGTRPTRIEKIRLKSMKKKELLVLTPLNIQFPKKLEAGEKVEFELPYNKSHCEFLFGDCSRVGLEDPFDKIHWVKQRDLKKAHKEWTEDLKRDKVPLSEGTIRSVNH